MTKQTRYFMAGSAAVLAAGLTTGLVAYYAGGFQPLSAASAVSTELGYVPADATMVAYADVRAIMDSDLRARLKAAMPNHETGQQEFQAKTGIDIERDIDYVVAALSPSIDQGSPLVVARGRFNSVQLEGLALQHGGILEEYKGKRMVVSSRTVEDDDAPVHVGHMVLAFLEPGLVAIGDLDAVKKAIDAQLTASSINTNAEMMELVTEMGAYNNAWAVGRFDVIASQAKLPDEVMKRLPPVKWFAAAGHINGGLSGTLRAEARDEKSGEELRAVVNGFLAAGRLAAQSDPTAANLVNSVQLSGTGSTVALSFTLPGELLNLIPKAAQ